MKVHFIAIGGSAMHNLAIALKIKGYEVSGSDDKIFEPSKSRLDRYGILPKTIGWDNSKIDNSLDAIILGMHAKKDNPELLKAHDLGLKIYSYPEYIYEQTKDKTRIVIGGSHGKTTITSMILHVFQQNKLKYDYLVGAQLEGFECMVKIDPESEFAVIEGDEYLSSPMDRRPKFHLYQPNIALLSGIAWDHINVFPTFENYVEQFEIFADCIQQKGTLIWYQNDPELVKINQSVRPDIISKPYCAHPNKIVEEETFLINSNEEVKLKIFGNHNLENLMGAMEVCLAVGITKDKFYEAISTFKGASRRMELLEEGKDHKIYKDFAHSPSKLKATTLSVKKQFPSKRIIACMELHTFSSLNKTFLQQYAGCMDSADDAIVFYSKEAIAHKNMEQLSKNEVQVSFANDAITIIDSTEDLKTLLKSKVYKNSILLLMSSGNYGGIDIESFAKELSNRESN